MANGIKHVFFDLDHTLWDFDRNSGLTFEKIFRIYNIEIDLIRFLKTYEPINLKYWKLYREEQVTKAELRYSRLREAFDSLNFQIEDVMINHLAVAYIDYLTTFNHLYEGALDILNYLQQKYELHIITNGFEEAQDRKLTNAEIKHYFKTITSSEMAGVKKPNPKIFNFALNAATATPEESIMIGDSLEADIEGAKNIGMDVLHFDATNTNGHHNLKRVTHLKAITNYL